MSEGLSNVRDVVAWRLCLGCGACVSACPEGALTLVDIPSEGLRPCADTHKCAQCGHCIEVCPGIDVESPKSDESVVEELKQAWGKVLEIWEGYAADSEIRFLGSSGGLATALSLYCLEKRQMQGVLHIGPKADAPLTNEAVLSRSRDDLLSRTGSRYAPAAPCTGLAQLPADGPPCVFVGKPCDIAALRKCQSIEHGRSNQIGLAISIFCAGTPSTKGTEEILEKMGLEPNRVEQFRYRGCGWPGRTVAATATDNGLDRSMTYAESWGTILSHHTQFRCRLCPDPTGELADISCGDPWYRDNDPDDPGRSLVLVRTPVGREILQGAIEAGYVQLEPAEPSTLPRSQKSVLRKRQHLWGRLLALRFFRAQVPCYRGFSLFSNWRMLSASDKIRSILGTIRRAYQRKWGRPVRRDDD